jgi:hypothetical protein
MGGLMASLSACGLEESGVPTGDTDDDGGHGAIRDAVAPLDGPRGVPDGTVSDGPSGPDAPGVDAAVDAPMDGAKKDAGHDAGFDVAHIEDAGAEAEASVDAGNITITGGPYTLEDEDAGVCSINSDTAASFTLDNERSAPIELDWIGYLSACAVSKYATVPPGGSYPQSTYVTNVWVVKDNATKAFLDEFVLDAPGPYTVTIH